MNLFSQNITQRLVHKMGCRMSHDRACLMICESSPELRFCSFAGKFLMLFHLLSEGLLIKSISKTFNLSRRQSVGRIQIKSVVCCDFLGLSPTQIKSLG